MFTDNDISAYSGRVRPQYRAMLDAVRAGEVKGILAWHSDRLHRRTLELEEFVSVAEAHNLQIETVTAGKLDLKTPSGRMVARMLGAAAQHEVDHARERVQRVKAEMARRGQFRGGPRAYGYEPDGITIRESEAEAIRRAMKDVIAGRSLGAIVAELNRDGYRTTQGREWRSTWLRGVLVRPRYGGLLAHGDPLRPEGDKNRLRFEIVGKAQWPGIVDEDTWRAVHAILADPSRRTHHSNRNKYIGSGVYVCGVPTGELDEDGDPIRCHAVLRPSPTSRKGAKGAASKEKTYEYRCSKTAHLMISGPPTDEFVMSTIAEMLRDPELVADLLDRSGGNAVTAKDREARAAFVARMESFPRAAALGQMTPEQVRQATEIVLQEIEEIDKRMTAAMRTNHAAKILRAEDPGQAFRDSPMDAQRALLAMLLHVEVRPRTNPNIRKWTPERLRITPLELPSED